MSNHVESAAEFRRMVEIADLGAEDRRLDFTASAEERKALAERFGLLALGRLEAAAWVHRRGRTGARARVEFEADVVQSCVVTLDPVESRIEETFQLDFRPAGGGPHDSGTAESDTGGEPPGEVTDGAFDLGAVIAEYVALAIDPYPRKPGVEPGMWRDRRDGGDDGRFAALKEWRGKA